MIELKNTSFGYPKKNWRLGPLNFLFNPGITLLLGNNASGKSTLLRGLAGLLPPIEGKVIINGKDSADLRRISYAQTAGWLKQGSTIPPGLTCEDVLSLGRLPYLQSLWDKELDVKNKIQELFEEIEIPCLPTDEIGEISGGTRQLVHVARLLVQAPQIYLLDEPMEGIDLNHQKLLMNIFKRETEEKNAIVLMATHHIAEPSRVANCILTINNGILEEKSQR